MEAVNEIAAALVKARAAFPAITKNRVGQARGGKYRYADLSSILDAITEPLLKQGISIVQTPEFSDLGPHLVTTLLHVSGQRLTATSPLPSSASSQEMGSAMTYARRYAICAMLSIAADDDDDGAEAEHAAKPQPQRAAAPAKPQPEKKAPASGNGTDGLFGGVIVTIEPAKMGSLSYHILRDAAGHEFALVPGETDQEKRASTNNLQTAEAARARKAGVVIEYHTTRRGTNIVDRVKLEE